jgi:hypothetical protein
MIAVKLTTAQVLASASTVILLHSPAAIAQLISNQQPEYYKPPAPFALTITDVKGHPIVGAQVLIGEAEGLPFEENVLISDYDGRVPLPQNWLSEQPVTIDAPGFVRATYLDLAPQVRTLKVRRRTGSKASAKRFELKGTATGFGKLKNDGIFDVSLVIQAVPRSELANISLQTMISPETDHISVMGQGTDIPSNVTIPDQTESYIIPLRFNKPSYRLYLPVGGSWNVATMHAQVPFKATADALRSGKQFIDIINTFNFVEGSINTVTLNQPSTQLDLPVNQTKYTKSVKFTAPVYAADLDLIALAMSPKNGAYYPTDVKSVRPSSSVKLWAPASALADGMVLAAFRKAGADTVGPESDQYSAIALPNNESRPVDAIRIVNPPQANQNQLVLDTPTPSATLNPVMTYGRLSIVTSISQGTMKMEAKESVWDVWAPNWVNKMDLPAQPLPKIDPSKQKLRWEVSFDGQATAQKSLPPGPGELEKVTHVSRSAVDL